MSRHMGNVIKEKIIHGAHWAMQNRRNAMLAALLTSALPLVSWLAGVIVALMTLTRGYRDGFLTLMTAYIPLLLITLLLKSTASLEFSLITGYLPLWITTCVLRRTQSWSNTIEFSTLLAITVIALTTYFVGDDAQFWLSRFKDVDLKQYTAMANLTKDELLQQRIILAHSLTHFIAFSMMVISLLIILFAQWIQHQLENLGTLRETLLSIRVSYVYVFILLGISVLGLLDVPFVRLHMALFFVPSTLAGFSLLQYQFHKHNVTKLKRILCYSFGFVMTPLAAIILSFAAITDRFYDLRRG